VKTVLPVTCGGAVASRLLLTMKNRIAVEIGLLTVTVLISAAPRRAPRLKRRPA
jgi:hypothetical protein